VLTFIHADKIAVSVINKEFPHLSIDLIESCLFAVPTVSGYSLFHSVMAKTQEVQEVRSCRILSDVISRLTFLNTQSMRMSDKSRLIATAWAGLHDTSARQVYPFPFRR
jgi:hypothetical protein